MSRYKTKKTNKLTRNQTFNQKQTQTKKRTKAHARTHILAFTLPISAVNSAESSSFRALYSSGCVFLRCMCLVRFPPTFSSYPFLKTNHPLYFYHSGDPATLCFVRRASVTWDSNKNNQTNNKRSNSTEQHHHQQNLIVSLKRPFYLCRVSEGTPKKGKK